MPDLIVVENVSSRGGRELGKTIAHFGHRAVLLRATPASPDNGMTVVEVDTSDPLAVLHVANSLRHPVVGIMSLSDRGVITASHCARLLNLAGPDPKSVAACRDKLAQARELSKAGLSVPWTVPDTPFNRQRMARVLKASGSLVVKPASGTGSEGVLRCRDWECVTAHVDRLTALGDRALVQEYVKGAEFSVEVVNGQAVAVLSKLLGREPHFVEIGHTLDVPAVKDRQLAKVAERAARALGLSLGVVHVELRLSSSGPVIIEVNPRPAGGGIPILIKAALGIDLIAEAVRVALGVRPSRTQQARSHAGAIRFVMADKGGYLEAVDGTDLARRVSNVIEVEAGDTGQLVEVGNFRQRVGHVIALGQVSADALSAATEAVNRMTPRVTPLESR